MVVSLLHLNFLWAPICKRSTTVYHSLKATLVREKWTMPSVCLYCPPLSKQNGLNIRTFFKGLPDCNFQHINMSHNFVLLGDLNFKPDNPSCWDILHVLTTLSDYCLTQLIQDPTHVRCYIFGCSVVCKNQQTRELIST